MLSKGLVAGAALVALGAAAVPAGAATPIHVGNGSNVAIAVDTAGTAHVAWRQTSPEASGYCRVPKGTTTQGCPAPQTFPPRVTTNGLFDRGLVALSGTTVAVLWRECCAPEEVNARISTNGGGSFGPVRTLAAVGADNPTGTTGDAITDGTRVGWSDGVSFQWAPLAGPAVTTRADLFGPVSFGGVSALRAGRPLVVEESDSKLLSFRRTPAGDVNDEANWNAAKPIPTTGTGFKRPSLAFDSTDVFLASTDQAGAGSNRPLVRRYLGSTDSFGARVLVADQSALQIDAAVDTTGRIDVVWSNEGGIWWSSSTNRGASFSSPVRLTEQDGVTHLRVGAGGDGGFAGFRTLDGGVWVVPLEETGPPPPPPPSPDTSIALVLDAKGKQKVRKLEVTIGCGDEACEADLGGKAVAKKKAKSKRASAAKKKGKKTFKVKPQSVSLAAGETQTQRVGFKKNKKSVKKLRKLLKRKAYRKKTKAKLKVGATDAAGNTATERMKVKLRR